MILKGRHVLLRGPPKHLSAVGNTGSVCREGAEGDAAWGSRMRLISQGFRDRQSGES